MLIDQFQGTVIRKEPDADAYTVRRDDLPNISSVIQRTDIYLREECRELRQLKVSFSFGE